MGNKIDAILSKPLHRRESIPRNYGHEFQHQWQPQHSSHHPHTHRQIIDSRHVQQIHQENRSSNKDNRHESDKQTQRSSVVGSFKKRKTKLSSCPDLLKETESYCSGRAPNLTSGLRECKSTSPEKVVNIKIYRSYTDLPSQGDIDQPLKIKVYRKSQESLANIGRVHSMPRGMDKTESREFSTSIESKLSFAIQEYNRPTSRRSSSRCSNASSSVINCRTSINLDDFPNMELVTKKLTTFEQFFNNLVIKYFKNMTILDQLASICVAIMPDRANQSVSLLQYLQSVDIPPDLGQYQFAQRHDQHNSNKEKVATFYPALPGFLLNEIINAKLSIPMENQISVCQDVAVKIITHIAKEASQELSRLYEYQLSLVQETIAFRLLAKFAATNVFEAVKNRGKLLDRNSIVSAAVNVHGRRLGNNDHGGASSSCPKWISVICFNKELKWNIYDIFRKSALRKDVFISDSPKYHSPSPSLSPASIKRSGTGLSPPPYYFSADRKSFDSSGNSPWKFYSNSESDPMTYGYRSQIVQWDFVRCCYRLSPNDESSFVEELPWRYDDLHRLYCPCFRLVCDLHLLDYYDWANFGEGGTDRGSESNATGRNNFESRRLTVQGFEKFIRQARSGPHVRDELKLIYRSVAGFDNLPDMEPKRTDLILFRNSLVRNEMDLLDSSQYTTEALSISEPNKGFHLPMVVPQEGGPRDTESLRRVLAQVTMECDQLCYNLQDIEPGG